MALTLLHAPDYPERMGTNVATERAKIISLLEKHRAQVREESRVAWHELCEQEVLGAFEAVESGKRQEAVSLMQQAERHFRRSFRRRSLSRF